MNLMKILPAALLLSVSLNAFAQDEDETLGDVEEEATEVAVPTTPSDVKFFHRVQLGYMGTSVKYTNNQPNENTAVLNEKYFLSGITFGWVGDLRIDKDNGLFLEVGANLGVHVGTSRDKNWNVHHDAYYRYKVKAFTASIPVSINKQFKDAFGVQDLTLAPFAGLNFRFNVMAKRKATEYDANGSKTGKTYTASLMETDKGPNLGESSRYMRSFDEKLHVGKLLQPGVQLGVNAYYQRYFCGISYMYDLMPFAKHVSLGGIETTTNSVGNYIHKPHTNCDVKATTSHNFMITVGYIL